MNTLAIRLHNMDFASPNPEHIRPADGWNGRFAAIRATLTKPRSLPRWLSFKALTIAAAPSALIAVVIVLMGYLMPAPHFALGKDADHIVSSQYQPLRRASDWLAHRKYAVLTFDDGPEGNGVDEQILAVLRHHHAHALFFVICNRLDDDTSRVIHQFEREGHIVGNHSFDHLPLTKVSQSKLPHQIEDCSQQLSKLTGHRPRYFRPPFGMTSNTVVASARKSGMHQVLWNANSYDDFTSRPDEIVRQASVQTDDASIILMHEKSVTASVLDRILTDLEHKGFDFVLPEDDAQTGAAS